MKMKRTTFRETGTDLWGLVECIERRARHNGINSEPTSMRISYKVGTKVLVRERYPARTETWDVNPYNGAERVTVEMTYKTARYRASAQPHYRGPHTTSFAMRGLY